MKKKGFTLVELMMVIAILAVLLGIITTAAMASIRKARERRTQASKLTLQNGIAAYKASRKHEWPGRIEDWASEANHNGKLGYLSNGDYDKVVQELLKVSAGKGAKNRVLDPVGLLVMNASNQDGSRSSVDYRSAATKKGKYGKRMSAREMTVVYQDAGSGRAYRFVIEYNTESDEVTVMTQGEYNGKYNPNWNGGEKWW
jgi:prepilin-type N-terminal cleavage/methylation domain-containing protein